MRSEVLLNYLSCTNYLLMCISQCLQRLVPPYSTANCDIAP